MRYLKPHFYDSFVCTGGSCPDTCCAGWQIMIDEDSLDRYGNEPGEFGKILRNSIDWEEECFYQNDQRCAFLNNENLCDIYRVLGADALCDTCRLYPRHTEEYEGLRELSLSFSCPEAAKIILSCKEPIRFLEEETDEEDDFEEFDFMMFSRLEDTRDVLFDVLQDRSLSLTLRMTVAEQLAEGYQICMEEQREFDIDDLLMECRRHQKENTLHKFISESLSGKGVDATSLHQWEQQKKELQVLCGLERLRPEWNQILDGAEKWLYKEDREKYQHTCEEFHRTYGALSSHKAEWENLGEQLLISFVYTYFCGAVYDDMVCSKMELALFSVRWIQEFLIVRWLENGKTLSMQDVEEITWRYAREIEHSDNNLNALEDWLFENYAPEGCILEETCDE
nr:flagellin lysine-N-methylase [uncultured Blautia sp.]